jgi:hypothetical protein
VRPTELRRQPTVSIVIPVYNYGHFLGACMRSVMTQEGVDLDVIIVDDASTDGSTDVVRQFVDSDRRIRGIFHAENKGHIDTFNEGIAAAAGEYVVLISPDDMLTPGTLARSAALLDSHPDISLVYGHPVTFSEDPPEANTAIRDWTVWPGLEWLRLRCERGVNCIRHPEAVMRTDAMRKAGPYVHKLAHTGDFAMWMRLATLGDVGRVNGPDQAFYREHSQNMSKTVNGGLPKDIAQRLKAFDHALVPSDGLPPELAKELLDTARRKVAREALGHAIQAQYRGEPAETSDEFVALARQAFPDVEELGEWRVLQRAITATAPERKLSLQMHEAARDLNDRLRWRRWRRYGV